MANVTSIPSDFPGMSKDNLDQYIVDFLNAIYGEEVRDKFARISYLLGHQVPDSVEDAATAASISAEAAMKHATAAKKSEVAAQQYMTTASEHVVKAGEYRTEAADSAAESQTNADQAYIWNQNCLTLYHQTQNLTNQVESYAEQILGVGYHVKIVTEDEYENLGTGFDPNTLYIVLESTYNPLDSLVSYYPLTSDLADYLNKAKVGQAIGCLGFGDWDSSGSSFYMKRTDSVPTATKRENYISLPNDLLDGIDFSNGATFVIRCKPDKTVSAGNGDWTRIFNFYKHASSSPNDGEGEVYLTQGLIGTWFYNAQSVQYLDASVAGTLAANQWHTVALVIEPIKPDNTLVKVSVFVDYRTIGSTQGVFAGTGWLNKVDQNWIGASRFDDDDFTGMVKDFRVYNKALSHNELTNVMRSNFKWRLRWNGGQDESFSDLDKKIQDILDSTTELPYLKTSGGTMEGPVDMDSHAITGLPDPTADTDAIPKGWADGRYTPLTAAIRPTVTGNPIHITDSAEAPVQELCVYGRTEQVTTTGAQLLDLADKQTTYGGITFNLSGGRLTITGSLTAENATFWYIGRHKNENIEFTLPAGSYYISDANIWLSGGSFKTGYFTLNAETGITGVSYTYDGTGATILYPMLNAGSTALPWEPYTGGKPSPSPDYPQELVSAGDDGQIDVTVSGKNLFDASAVPVENLTHQVEINDQVFNMTSDRTDFYIGDALDTGKSITSPAKAMSLKVSQQTTYTLSLSDERLTKNYISFYDEDYIAIAGYEPIRATSGTFTTPEGCAYISVRIGDGNSTVGQTYSTTIMLNAGSTALPWEPYTDKTITLTGDLPGIPVDSGGNYTDPDGQQWVCNYRDWGRGVDVQKIELFSVTDTTNIVSLSEYNTTAFNAGYWPFRVREWEGKILKYSQAMSNIFLFELSWGQAKESMYTVEKTIDFNIEFSRIGVTSETAPEDAVTKAKQWLTAQSAVFLCQLIKPVETPIPAEELSAYKALQTYDGTTNVTATDGAGLSMRYVSDTKKYIDNKIAELQQQLAETQNALLEG